jgi:sulfur carrier protein ThiS
MPTFSNIDGEESNTVTFTVGAVSLTRNSSVELQEILCIGDPETASSLGIARVLASAPASTNAGLGVRIISGPSSVADFSVRAVLPSTAADNVVNVSSLAGKVLVDQNSTVWPVQIPTTQSIQVKNSTIGDLLASVQQNSTVWAVQADGRVRAQNSTIGDLLASVQQNSTVWAVQIPTSQSVQVKNSTIGDLLASVQQNSTVWQVQAKIQDSSGVGFIGTITRPTTGVQGMAVRVVLNDLQSTAFSTMGNNSTSSTIVSSAASVRHKVYAYSITSTAQAVNTLTFASSLANMLWTVQMQAFSSGISGANLAVTPPAWLFATESASPLVFKVTGTTGTYHLSFSYFSEA